MSKAFLKWAGGKTKLVPFIKAHLPAHFLDNKTNKRLIEPFAGSASVSLLLDFDEYLLNDSNVDLINLYKVLAEQKQEFIAYAKSYFCEKNNQERRFYELRDEFNNSDDIIKKSALFIYLNRHAFNGLCRYNKKGGFNVPFGRYKSPYFPKDELLNFVDKSSRMRFFCGDFAKMFDFIDSNDVIYCDPPYMPLSETASFASYAKDGFNFDDQMRLANLAQDFCYKAQAILISNHDTKQTRNLYQGAIIKTVQVQRNIAAKASSRQKVGELLAIYKKNNIRKNNDNRLSIMSTNWLNQPF
ncbi:DNA adenine methylase [Moraxella macacae 0408225]|uniref:Site-specific DNA-methyltransferase (adenine-specific) n=2 Tax=Moraxella macacae TaxID=765840 RepID=L2F4N8_9GAMM|nr:DNA adenine methylase [Moraxella macacae 0408225]